MSNHLAIDLGATSGRSILASFNGTTVTMRELTRFPHPMLPIAGHWFWDLPGLYNEILKALKKVADEGIEIESIGIDTWGVDVAYFNADGTLAGLPYCYRDPHTDDAQERLFSRIPKEEIYARTGIQFMNFNTLFQLDTIRPKADKLLFMPDALGYMLTGNAVTEYTIASTSQFLNPMTGDLDESLLSEIGLKRSQFGPLVKPGTVIGHLTEQIQKETGLGPVKVIAVAGHDTASAVIGTPASSDNYAYLSCGTWSLLGVESPQAIITEDSAKYNWTNEGGIDGTTRFLKNICGLWLFEQSRKEFKDAPEDVGALVALCQESDCDSIIDPDDAVFTHPESMTRAIAVKCEESGQRVPTSPADFIRVIFRSLAAKYKYFTQQLRDVFGQKIDVLHVIGGGSKNAYLMQMTADALQIPVIAGPSESTAMGNILTQLRGIGALNSLKEMREVSRNSVETKKYLPK